MDLVESLRAFLTARSTQAYLVGGAVRDILLERDNHDLDVSVAHNAAGLARAFADARGGAFFLMDETFDVARVILEEEGTREIVDFARVRGADIHADLATRDFTINAMAADALTWKGDPAEIIDPFNGVEDVKARRVRMVSDEVFRNDPVRLVRAARMEAELDLALDAETEQQVRRDAALVESAPVERVRDEFMRILAADHPLRNLRRLDALDLLGRILPELNALRGVTQSAPHIYDVFEHSLHAVHAAESTEQARYSDIAQGAFGEQLKQHFARPVASGRTRRELLRLALLLHDIGKPATRTVEENGRIRFLGHEEVGATMAEDALRRLKFSNDEVALIRLIVKNHMRPLNLALNGITSRAIYRFFRDTGESGVDTAVHSWCDQRATGGAGLEHDETAALQGVIGKLLDRYYHAHQTVVAPPTLVNGKELMEYLQLPPGPHVGVLLEALREAQATGEVRTHAEALDFLSRTNNST